MYNQPHKLSVT